MSSASVRHRIGLGIADLAGIRRCVEAPSASLHPMHALLEPLLLTTRSVTNKYHSELLQILANGGGAGEMEEAMMWYSVEHEKPDNFDGLPAGPSPQKRGQDGEEGQWTDEKWREEYLDRMERREVQIQILLYMFKLSLPEHRPPPSLGLDDGLKTLRPGKRKRTSKPVLTEPTLSIEDHLEAFMDNLAMWQLVGRIDDRGSVPKPKMDRTGKDDWDWAQIFVEDIVEPQFKAQLPELCKILRTKVFPTSPFSDTESDTTPTRNASPDPTVALHSPTTRNVPTGLPLKPALSRTSSTSLSRAPSLSRAIPSPTHSTTTSFSSRNLIRSRSTSLSMSLAQEQEERAAAAAAAAEQQTRKRGRLHREVSMTRVFKNEGKGKGLGGPGAGDARNAGGNATLKIEAPKVEKTWGDKGVTLVDETPIKPRILSTLEKTKNVLIEPLNLVIANSEGSRKGDSDLTAPMFADEEEEWMMDSSPAVVVFDPLLEKQKDKVKGTKSTVVKGGGGSEEEWDKKGNTDQRTRSKPSRGRSRR